MSYFAKTPLAIASGCVFHGRPVFDETFQSHVAGKGDWPPVIHRLAAWWQRRHRAAAEASAAATWRARHCGPDVWLDPTVQVLGWRRVRIGAHSILSEGIWLNVNDRDSDEPAITIGTNCFLGRRNLLSSGSVIEIGDYCLTGVDVHFLGADHIFDSPFVPYIVSGVTNAAAIRVGVNCWFGASVTVLKGSDIGYGSVIGAGSVVKSTIPPFSIVVGSPARVVRRFDLRKSAWVRVADFPAEAEDLLPGEAAYRQELRQKWPNLKGPLVASGPIQGDI